MARWIGPDEASREVKGIVGRDFLAKVGHSAQLWADEAATVPADVLWPGGAPIPHQKPYGNGGRGMAPTVDIDANSFLPDFLFPPGDVTTIYGTCDGGPAWPIYARTKDRVDALEIAVGGTARKVDIQAFTVPGTSMWNKPDGAKVVQVIVVSGGGGGGSGRRGAAGAARVGGGGGAGGAFTIATMEADQLPATVPLVVGAGGAGGPSKVTDNTDGQNGVGGGASVFGSTDTFATDNLVVRSGGAAGGGFGGAGTGGTAGTPTFGMWAGSGAGASPVSGFGGANGGDPNAPAAAPGGGGGGVSAADVPGSGGSGGVNAVLHQNRAVGGAAPGGNGAAGRSALTRTSSGGNGGGGGAGSTTGPAGTGGQGGYPGGGGGGGGASLNGFPSGAGGRGGDGLVAVITYF